MENLVKLCRRNAHYSCLLVNHALLEHVHCHVEGSDTGPLSYAALEHPELAVLDCELDVLHIAEVLLKMEADAVKFGINFRHCSLKRLKVLVVRVLCRLVERVRGTDTCNHVLSLCVDEPLSVEFVVTVGRVT